MCVSMCWPAAVLEPQQRLSTGKDFVLVLVLDASTEYGKKL